MPRKRHVYTAPELVDSNSEEGTETWDRFKKLGPVLVALASILTAVSFIRDIPNLGLGLLVISAAIILWATTPAMRVGATKVFGFFRKQLLVWRNRRKLRSFAAEVGELLRLDNPKTLSSIVLNLCGRSYENAEKIVPPVDIVNQWFHCFEVHLRSPIWRFQRFSRLTHELTWIVSNYNKHYILRGRRRLRQCYLSPSAGRSLPVLTPEEVGKIPIVERKELPEHYAEELDLFREHYVRFLVAFMSWLKDMNTNLGRSSNTSFMDWFEEPGKF